MNSASYTRVGICLAVACAALAFALLRCAAGPTPATEPVNLALHKPATSSSIENDEHDAAKANDGDPDTCWRADDEPETGADWWQVDLQRPADLSGGQIQWPYDGMRYRYKVEGSADGKSWSLLSDQTATRSRSQVQDVKFSNAAAIRYVKITITGFDDGCLASLSEVRIFGTRK